MPESLEGSGKGPKTSYTPIAILVYWLEIVRRLETGNDANFETIITSGSF